MGILSIELDENSREITMFIHELGIFEYLRAPMGLNASGDNFVEELTRPLQAYLILSN